MVTGPSVPTRRAMIVGAAALTTLGPIATQAQDRIPVVATFSILGDFVREIGGDRIVLTVLVGPNGDAHVYTPTPADARRINQARLIVTNGLKFEGWITRLIRSSGTRAAVIEAAKGAATIVVDETSPAHDHGDHSHAGDTDPHAWQSVANAKIYAANIRDALIAIDPAGDALYRANNLAYLAKLDVLDADIRDLVSAIPPERRKIVTSHDAFGYFGHAYGLKFLAPQGISTQAEVSAAGVARLIQQIRRDRIAAVFLENMSDARLAKRIAADTGATVGGTLYADALSGPDGPAGTYIAMMRHNARTIADALKP